MKFARYLESITGVGIFPLLSLIMFVLFFVAVAIWAFRIEKKTLDEMKKLPLEKFDAESLKSKI